MKNYINYFYNLKVNNLVFTKNKYFFISSNGNYLFKVYDANNVFLYYNLLELELSKYKFFMKIVPNKSHSLITNIENKSYVLLKNSFSIPNDRISIFDIKPNIYINLLDEFSNLKRFPWIKLWESKIDYLEKWIFEKKSKYKKIYPIFNYFLGMSENALLYLKETIKNEMPEAVDKLSIQHNRMEFDSSLYDYYDPTAVILDHPARDISEYVKSACVNGKFELELFESYLEKNNFSKYGIMVMYSRILFPSFFFDYFEKFIMKKANSELFALEDKIKDLEKFLAQITGVFLNKYGIECPKWILKIN